MDLGSSDQEKLKRQMEQYAKTGNVDDPTFRAQKKAEPRYAEWDPCYKEQQERLAREKAAETAAAKKSPVRAQDCICCLRSCVRRPQLKLKYFCRWESL